MTEAAHIILKIKRKNVFGFYPFAADSFCNEIDDEARYDTIYFPDENPSNDAGNI
jgi:hypothetical protein